jgi:archaellum biogenesis ATPase FlaH
MTEAEKEKAALDYLPAPTGLNQPLNPKPTTNVSQASADFNDKNLQNSLKLINMSDVEVEKIDWLWHPYIAYGKITVIQGDPGTGKTTMILAIAAAVTKGEAFPENEAVTVAEPTNVIFQTAEDGLGDTVKPRLLQAGADCSRVIVIDESEKELSLSDTRVEEALTRTGAKLFILDPLQAYLGAGVDMHRANEVRPVLKKISLLAEKTGCAIVVVGHLNKGTNQSQYRGLGSIDIQAAARSVLTVGRIKGNQYMRAFAHGKSNIAPEGPSIAFELNPGSGFRWIGTHPVTIEELLSGKLDKETAAERAQDLLTTELTGKTIPANDVFDMASALDISDKTLKRAKPIAGVRSFKKNNRWFWTIDDACAETQKQGGQQLSIKNFGPLGNEAESTGITGVSPPSEKQGGQEAHIEKFGPLAPCDNSGGTDEHHGIEILGGHYEN